MTEQVPVIPVAPTIVPGDTLRNGATVIACGEGEPQPVLCLWNRGGAENIEYVTWMVDANGDAFWGHYFGRREFRAAAHDYLKRWKETT